MKHKVNAQDPLELVRVSPEEGDTVGGWLMLREDFDRIRKLPNSEKILKRFFALEETPKYFNKFTPPSGVEFEMNYSIVKDNKWGAGGALQFQLGERVPAEWFEENRRLIKGDIQ